MQPCWTCTKYLGGCPWSARFQPVPGWKAKPVKRRAMPHSAKEYVDTYDIKSCPMYVSDGSREPEERGCPSGIHKASPEDERLRLDLYYRGMTDLEIAEAIGTTKAAIRVWRHRRKLEVNKKK